MLLPVLQRADWHGKAAAAQAGASAAPGCCIPYLKHERLLAGACRKGRRTAPITCTVAALVISCACMAEQVAGHAFNGHSFWQSPPTQPISKLTWPHRQGQHEPFLPGHHPSAAKRQCSCA